MKKYYNIQLFRKEKNFTQERMAEKLGISQNAYNKIENGHCNIKAETLEHIALILGKDIKDLVKNEDDKLTCHVEQHNPQNSVGGTGNDVTYNQHDFDKERTVWQSLVKSLQDVIDAKSEVIASQNNLIMILQK
jgi:transcriptional regulator with XRE-family HTH domain